MTDLVIYGAGGMGQDVYHFVRKNQKEVYNWEEFSMVGVIDDKLKKGKEVFCRDFYCVGGIKWLSKRLEFHKDHPLGIIIAIGDPFKKHAVYEKIMTIKHTKDRIFFPTILASDFRFFSDPKIGSGVTVYNGCSIASNVTIGNFVNLSLNCTVGHNTIIQNFSTISPGVNISGNVYIAPRVHIGSGSVILPGIHITDDVIIGAGSVVTKDITDPGIVVAGNPAKYMRPRNE